MAENMTMNINAAEMSNSEPNQEESTHINIKVEFPEGVYQNYKLKKTTLFKKLMDTFYIQNNVSPASVRFLFDDCRIKPLDTPESIEIEEGDVISVYSEQQAGDLSEQSGHISEQAGDISEQSGHISEQSGHISEQAGEISEQSGHISELAGEISEQSGGLSEQSGGLSEQSGKPSEEGVEISEY